VSSPFDGYAAEWTRQHGGELRYGAAVRRGWLRLAYSVATIAAGLRVPPTAVTVGGLLLCLTAPGLANWGGGWPIGAAVMVLLATLADNVDGALAVLRSRTTPLGGLYDSIVDRLVELCWLAALWVLGAPFWLLACCGAVSWLHEYVRTRAFLAGLALGAVGTAGDRIWRVVCTVGGLLGAGLVGLVDDSLAAGPVTIAAAFWLVLGLVGLVQLFVAAHRT
jgi:CDP-diacylglycerol--glycerol-3-phosphate 3-phosphatidyltransferase